ncbi:MAG: hypothetical protein OHK0048_01060 [Rhodoferax sp.]
MPPLTPMVHIDPAVRWLRGLGCTALRTDSRAVQPGDAFLAWPGAAHDARAHIPSALQAGARACLFDPEGASADLLALAESTPELAAFAGLKAASGALADAFYGHPSQQLRVLAVTGTNGKTSTAWWLAQSLSNQKLPAHVRTGFVGTLGIGEVPHLEPTGLTTPDPVRLHATLADWVALGFGACAMEASSIGLAEHRMAGVRVHTALFTNLTQDHLDYHGNMAAYAEAKARLFDAPGLQAAVINIDDAWGATLAERLRARSDLDLWTVGRHAAARLRALDLQHSAQGMAFDVAEAHQTVRLSTPLVGDYNVNNLLGVIAGLRCLGWPLSDAVAACAALSPVPGRLQTLSQPDAPLVVVDYAHTPDALAQVLQALRPLAQARGGRLWCVFGCGGDRDPSKRPLMGGIAAQRADAVIVTSDNPRSEPPQAIIDQILCGIPSHAAPVQQQVDRAVAIEQALTLAAAADVVLIAGKGHEDYQDIMGRRLPFSDLAQAQAALAKRTPAPCAQRSPAP